jgi:hypothetical protein
MQHTVALLVTAQKAALVATTPVAAVAVGAILSVGSNTGKELEAVREPVRRWLYCCTTTVVSISTQRCLQCLSTMYAHLNILLIYQYTSLSCV